MQLLRLTQNYGFAKQGLIKNFDIISFSAPSQSFYDCFRTIRSTAFSSNQHGLATQLLYSYNLK